MSLVKILQRLLKYHMMKQRSFHSTNSLIQPKYFFSRDKYSIFTYFCLSHIVQAGNGVLSQCFSLNVLESSFVSGAVGHECTSKRSCTVSVLMTFCMPAKVPDMFIYLSCNYNTQCTKLLQVLWCVQGLPFNRDDSFSI